MPKYLYESTISSSEFPKVNVNCLLLDQKTITLVLTSMYYNSQQSHLTCFAKKCYSLILGLCRRRTAEALFLYTVYNRQCLLARPRSDLWTLDMLQAVKFAYTCFIYL